MTVEIRVYCDARVRGLPGRHAAPAGRTIEVDAAELEALKSSERAAAGRCPCGAKLAVAFMWRMAR